MYSTTTMPASDLWIATELNEIAQLGFENITDSERARAIALLDALRANGSQEDDERFSLTAVWEETDYEPIGACQQQLGNGYIFSVD